MHVVELGGGRKKSSDQVDFGVGLIVNKKIGNAVKKGEVIATIHYHKHQKELAEQIADSLIKNDIKILVSIIKDSQKHLFAVALSKAQSGKQSKI